MSMSHESNPFGDSPFYEAKYDEPRLPTFEETVTQERLEMERSRLMEATKGLSRLKLEMEATIRAEMEAKIRAEMDANMRMDVAQIEKKRKAQEEHRLLEMMKEEMRNATLVSISSLSAHYKQWSHISIPFVKANNVIWYRSIGINKYTYSYGNGYGGPTANYTQHVSLYLSEEHIALHIVFIDQSNTHEEIRPFYWFDSKLTHQDLSIWNKLNSEFQRGRSDVVAGVSYLHPFTRRPAPLHKWEMSMVNSFLSRMYAMDVVGPLVPKLDESYSVNCFQTIVRLIPGSYKNSPWRPLDGFFGPYLNEDTLEITTPIPLQE
jgi:hypothetical protein